jgi:HAD superfamily hydrolase (TIGR01509 family)
MTRHLAAVVFDLDGTLLDTMASAPAAYASALRALGGPAVSPADVVATWHIGPAPMVLAYFLGRPATPDDLECLYRHTATASAGVRAFPGVPEMLHALRAAGYRLGVFTSATGRIAKPVLGRSGIARFFATVICGDNVDRSKPDPEGLLLACRRLGVTTGEAAYVGDAEVDLRCARAAGAAGIHARWGGRIAPIAGRHLVAGAPSIVVDLVRSMGTGRRPGQPGTRNQRQLCPE